MGLVLERDLSAHLQRNGRLQLLEGQNKEKLASYLVENLWLDGSKLRMHSSVPLQHEPGGAAQSGVTPEARASLERIAEASS